MGVFYVDIDIYFWMIDRGDLQDDQRNKVEVDHQRVRLHSEYGNLVENGYFIGQLLHVIRREIIKKSKKPFNLDPQLNNLRESAQIAARQHNWNLLIQELKKFNIKYTKEQKAQCIGGKQSLIHDILQRLFDYDQRILAWVERKDDNSQDNGLQMPNIKDHHSEINYGSADNHFKKKNKSLSVLKGESRKMQDHLNTAQQPARNLLKHPQTINASTEDNRSLAEIHEDQQFRTIGKPKKLPDIASIRSAHKPSLKQNYLNFQNDHINGGQPGYSEDRDLDAQTEPSSVVPDPSYPGTKVGLFESSTTFEFILESLSQSLGMSQNQATALLANNQKFLMHICIRGLKGHTYTKILTWYRMIMQHNNKLVELLELESQDPKALNMTFRVLKSGLFSQNAELVITCAKCLTKVCSTIYQQAEHDEYLNNLRIQVWEWLISDSGEGVSPHKLGKMQIRQEDIDSMLAMSGLQSFMQGFRNHEHDFNEQFAITVVQFGKQNYMDLFTFYMKEQAQDSCEHLRFVQDIFNVIIPTPKGKRVFLSSGVISHLIEICLQNSGIEANSGLAIAEKEVSLSFLTDIWKLKPEIIQDQQNQGRIAEAMIQVLKKSSRDHKSKSVRLTAIYLMFSLLDGFAKSRNMYAPIIYKTLTFILVECYAQPDIKDEILANFVALFQKYHEIPIQILCEPLFKQIQINFQKEDRVPVHQQQNSNLQPTSDLSTLNTSDFNLFNQISIHSKLPPSVAKELLGIVMRVARKDIIFTRVSLKLMLTLISRFESNTSVFEQCQGEIKTVLKTIQEQDQAKMEIYNALKKGNQRTGLNRALTRRMSVIDSSPNKAERSGKLDTIIDDGQLQALLDPQQHQQESALYMNLKSTEKLIVNLLQCLIQTSSKVLTEYIRDEVLSTYSAIEKRFRFKNKGLFYLLGMFDKDVNKMLQFTKETSQAVNKFKQHTSNKNVIPKVSDAKIGSFQNYQFVRNLNDLGSLPNVADSFDIGLDSASASPKKGTRFNPGFNSNERSHARRMVKKNTLAGDGGLIQEMIINDEIEKRKMHLRKASLILPQHHGSLLQKEDQVPEYKLKLFEINDESMAEQQKYLFWVKDKLKLYRAMFQKYSWASQDKRKLNLGTFDAMSKQKQSMSLRAVHQWILDFKIPLLQFMRREEVKRIIQVINLRQESNLKSVSDLDLEGFIEFFLQMAYFQFRNITTLASRFLPMFYEKLAQASLKSKGPLFQRWFDDYSGLSQMIQSLTEKVNQDPTYELPSGYTKVRADKIREVNGIDPSIYPKESQRIAVGILDDHFSKIFGIKLIEPLIKNEKTWIVKQDANMQKARLASPISKKLINSKARSAVRDSIELETPSSSGIKGLENQYGANQLPSTSRLSSSLTMKHLGTLQKKEFKPVNRYGSKQNALSGAESNQSQHHPYVGKPPRPDFLKKDNDSSQFDSINRMSPRNSRLIGSPPTRKLNKILSYRQEQEKKRLLDEHEKEMKQMKRQESVKKKLELFKKKKLELEAMELQKKREEQQKKKQLDMIRLAKKKKYYEDIKKQFEDEKLPEIHQNSKKQQEIKKKQILEQKQRKEAALKRIEQSTKALSDQFKEMSLLREKDKELMEKQEEEERKEMIEKRKKLAEKYEKKHKRDTSQP